MDDSVLNRLSETYLYTRIKKIIRIYSQLEKKQKVFCEAFEVHCPEHCAGECCRHYLPELTEAEADFLAYGLIKEGKDGLVMELVRAKKDASFCPLYTPDNDAHCLIYKWRPLLCRLFGAAASTDKNGKAVFRKCAWNTDGHDISPENFEAHQKALLLMHDVEMQLEEAGENSGETRPLAEALEQGIAKVRYLLELFS